MPGFTRSSAERIARAVRRVERNGGRLVQRRGKFDSSDDFDCRWKVTKTGDLELEVGDGTWTRNNIALNWTTDTVTLPSTDGTYYIYLMLDNSASDDPSVKPDGFYNDALQYSTTLPDDSYNKILIIAIAVVEDGVISDYKQLIFCDVDDWCDVPDSELQASHTSETLEFAVNGGIQLRHADQSGSRNKYAKLNTSNQLEWADFIATDEKVAVDSAATPGYLGANDNDGVLQCDGETITKTDNDNFITLSVIKDSGNGVASTQRGLPAGGSQYQVLVKKTGTDYDVKWDWVRAHG